MTPNNKNKWMEWFFFYNRVDNGCLLKRQKGLIRLHVHDVHISEPQMWVKMSELKVFLVATVRESVKVGTDGFRGSDIAQYGLGDEK